MARFNKMYIKKLFLPDGKDKGQLDKLTRITATASELNIMDGVTSTAAELNILDGVTATAAELNQNDASANAALMTVGAGISDAATAIVKYGISRAGDIITTQILIDITGLQSGAGVGDIFGDPTGAGAASNFGQITTAVNGVVWGGNIRCLETPAGCNVDIDVAQASTGAGVQDANGTALTNYGQLANCGNHAAKAAAIGMGPVTANYYLYLLAGAATDVVASAGRFLITLHGYVA